MDACFFFETKEKYDPITAKMPLVWAGASGAAGGFFAG